MSKDVTLYNGKTAHHDLYFGGGCFPDFDHCPDLTDKMALQKIHGHQSSGLGHKNTGPLINYDQQLRGELWPAPPIKEDDCYPREVAAHREAGVYGLSRHLCFVCPKDKQLNKPYQNQDALMRYYWQQRECNMEVPFSLGVVNIPPEIVAHGVWFKLYGTVPGLEFDIIERFSGEPYFTGIDGSVEDCQWLPLPPAQQMVKKQRIIDICINAMPPLNEDNCKPGEPSLLDGLCIAVSAVVCCPDTGNG